MPPLHLCAAPPPPLLLDDHFVLCAVNSFVEKEKNTQRVEVRTSRCCCYCPPLTSGLNIFFSIERQDNICRIVEQGIKKGQQSGADT